MSCCTQVVRCLGLVVVLGGVGLVGKAAAQVYVAVAADDDDYYGCTYYPSGSAIACGQVHRYTPGSGSELVATLEDKDFGELVAAGADGDGNVLMVTDSSTFFGGGRGCLLRNDQGLAMFTADVVDVDVAGDGTAWVATAGGGYYSCNDDYGYPENCGKVYRWTPKGGLKQVVNEIDLPTPAGSEITSVAYDALSGSLYLTAANIPEYQSGKSRGYLIRDGQIVWTFGDRVAIDVDIGPDGMVWIATTVDEAECGSYYKDTRCGGTIYRWDPSGTVDLEEVFTYDGGEDRNIITGVAVDGDGNWYFTTASSLYSYYESFGGQLFMNGALVADYPTACLDVDGGLFGAPPPAPPGPEVLLVSFGHDYDCLEGPLGDCGTLYAWEPSTGTTVVEAFPGVPDQHGYYDPEAGFLGVAGDLQGNTYAAGIAYDGVSEFSVLYRNGEEVASFSDEVVDVDVSEEGRVYMVTNHGHLQGEGGTIHGWDVVNGLYELATLDFPGVSFEEITGIAATDHGDLFVTTGGFDSDEFGTLRRNGEVVATFDAFARDVDAALDGSLWVATDGTDCYEGGLDCGSVWRWTEAGGAELIFSLVGDSDLRGISGVAVSRGGDWYIATGGDYYGGYGQGALLQNGVQVAAIPFGINDVEAVQFFTYGVIAEAGPGLAGAQGTPALTGSGTLLPGSPTELSLRGARANTTAALVVGLSRIDAPFRGGVIVPSPDVVLFGLPVDADGTASTAFFWPDAVPAASTVWFQHWLRDDSGPAGFTASNALSATSP